MAAFTWCIENIVFWPNGVHTLLAFDPATIAREESFTITTKGLPASRMLSIKPNQHQSTDDDVTFSTDMGR